MAAEEVKGFKCQFVMKKVAALLILLFISNKHLLAQINLLHSPSISYANNLQKQGSQVEVAYKLFIAGIGNSTPFTLVTGVGYRYEFGNNNHNFDILGGCSAGGLLNFQVGYSIPSKYIFLQPSLALPVGLLMVGWHSGHWLSGLVLPIAYNYNIKQPQEKRHLISVGLGMFF